MNMTDYDIVVADHKKNHSQFTLDQCLTAYELARLNPKIRRYRAGNSLLFIRDLGEGNGHFHFVNADKANLFCDNIKICMQKAKEDGFKQLTTDYTNPKVTEVGKATGLDMAVEETLNKTFKMTVRL